MENTIQLMPGDWIVLMMAVVSVAVNWGMVIAFKANIETRMAAYEKEMEVIKKEQSDTAIVLERIKTMLENGVVPNIKEIKDQLNTHAAKSMQIMEELIKLKSQQ